MTEELQAGPVLDSADVTVLEDISAPGAQEEPAEPVRFTAEVALLKQPFMDLVARSRIPKGAAVKVETADALWLGEIEQCSEAAGTEGVWNLRVRLRHVLRDFETLARLAERFGLPPVKGAPFRTR